MKRGGVSFGLLIAVVALVGSIVGGSATAWAQGLPTWSGSFTYQGINYPYTMIGTAPSSNTSTTIPVYLIPLTLTFDVSTCSSGQTTFSPNTVLSNGRTVVQNVELSPIFDRTTEYVQGGVDVGTTQYVDAFQRANFWGQIPSANKTYHLLLQDPPTVLTYPFPIEVAAADGEAEDEPQYGGCIGNAFATWWTFIARGGGELQSVILQYFINTGQVTTNSLPIFLTYNVMSNGAGLHYSIPVNNDRQTYIWNSYIGYTACPSGPYCYGQDVSILAHEVAEWADDPFSPQNEVVCGALEVGDPFYKPQYYFPYTVNNFTYHVQDLAFLPYFGAPTSTSVNGWLSFQNEASTVCQFGD